MFFADDRHNPGDGVQTTSSPQQNDACFKCNICFSPQTFKDTLSLYHDHGTYMCLKAARYPVKIE